jgi:hypothetical protein
MSYATGSGDYNALMAAVLAFAVADGWVEAGGVGTGWPISKGNVRGVDWDTFTIANTDYTGGSGVAHTTRWIRIAVGSSPANATANLGNDAAHFPNMEYNIDAWHIFSDPSIGDHVNVVVQFSNGIDAKVFGHFSFGELNKHGMTYGGLAYASAHPVRGFSPDVLSNRNNGNDAHSGIYARIYRAYTGRLGYSYTDYFTYNPTCFMVEPTNNPFPNLPIWPSADTLYNQARMMDVYGVGSSNAEPDTVNIGTQNAKFSVGVMEAISQPYSGGVSLGPLPMLIANTTSNSSTLRFINVGSFPNIRVCSLENLLEGDEITFASDTWAVFPVLCRKEKSTLGGQYQVTSGRYGFAYKKVV